MQRRHELRRWLAPFAFLLALTIAVVLVHRALSRDDEPTQETTVQIEQPRTTTQRKRTRATTTAGVYYVVQSGDTFGTIAARYGLTVEQIQRLNPGVSSNSLTVGQRIRVQ